MQNNIKTIRQLNQYNYTDYAGIVNFVRNGQVPANIRDVARFREKFRDFSYYENAELRLSHLTYHPLEVIIAKSTDADREYFLKEAYADYPGYGIGIFYEIVSSRIANITKAYTTAFLKRQVDYQLAVLPKKQKVRTKQYKNPNSAWAIDLIDMHNNPDNMKNHILTIVDLYNARVFLRALPKRDSESVAAALRLIFAVEKPKIILGDNGGEFQLQDLYQEYGIKFITTPSHTPQPHVENMNKQVRKMLRSFWIRDRNTLWVNNLVDVEKSLNNYNLKVKKKKPIPDPSPYKPRYEIGNFVRIALSKFYPKIREMNKAGLGKHITVKWTLAVFKVFRRFKSNDANSLAYYGLKDADGDIVENNEDNKPFRFKESDLQQVSERNDGDDNMMTVQRAEYINNYLLRAKQRRQPNN